MDFINFTIGTRKRDEFHPKFTICSTENEEWCLSCFHQRYNIVCVNIDELSTILGKQTNMKLIRDYYY